MKWWCIPCCDSEVPDIDIKMNCPSTCCSMNKTDNDYEIDLPSSTQAKLSQEKKHKHGKKHRRRKEKKIK